MVESLISPQQERLLAALFTRSHITNRRRRHPEGYLLSELDGVTLSQSEIWVNYRELVKMNFIAATTVQSQLVMRLTDDGELYCRQVIYSELFSGDPAPPIDTAVAETGPISSATDLSFLRGLPIDAIVSRLQDDPALADEISRAAPPEGALPDASREDLRRAVMSLTNTIYDLRLHDFEHAQADACNRIIMILADAPAASKKDITHFLGIVADLLGIGSFAWVMAQATIAYVHAN